MIEKKSTRSGDCSKLQAATKEKQAHDGASQIVVTAIVQALQRDVLVYPPSAENGPHLSALDSAITAAFDARQLLTDKALAKELRPLGYYIRDEDLADQNNVDKLPGGGIHIDPI